MIEEKFWDSLEREFEGKIHRDSLTKTIYATDASAYREIPLAVVFPKHENDIKLIIQFAQKHKTSLIPRTAGTSLAGQVVGSGIIVDVSRTFNRISKPDLNDSTVWVQPGVIRDELNLFLKPHDLYFGPETSTANRAMIGGMVGNNSCGSNSVVYGSTREHLLKIRGFLSDGSEIEFGPLSKEEFEKKCSGKGISKLEQAIYQNIKGMLSSDDNGANIHNEFPKPEIKRRNTGYAIDMLLSNEVFDEKSKTPFNFCQLIAGSEGTLLFITDIQIKLSPKPSPHKILIAAHFDSLNESLEANLIGLKHNLSASELMDHYVLDCTKENIEQRQNRFFIQGEPKAILVFELTRDDMDTCHRDADALIQELNELKMGYHYPKIIGDDVKKIWNLRKAGLGLLSNIPGDAKAVPVIEDTAVDVNDLPAYIKEFNLILDKHGLYCVHYAHAGSGELHLRPIIDLKTKEGNQLFRIILEEIAILVKKYRGSLSGEHGDGRLRGEFIKKMVGSANYKLFEEIKDTWDPNHIFNPGKIVRTPPMNSSLRYTPDQQTPEFKTYFNWDKSRGVLRAAELCNGSGDCRKTEITGGTMCPSYMATRDEKDTTRARANILREFLTKSDKRNRFDHEEIKEVMDLCLSCKGCKSECPSNVDMARLKAEFQQQYFDENGADMRSKLIANYSSASKVAALAPGVYNFFTQNKIASSLFKSINGFAQARSIPKMHSHTLSGWCKKHPNELIPKSRKGSVWFFIDEFTEYQDTVLGVTAIKLLVSLGFEVKIPNHIESGRTWLSKGFVKKAREIAKRNVALLSDLVDENVNLVGIEPSAILTFRDEYPDLVDKSQREKALEMAKHCYVIEEFIARAKDSGLLNDMRFTEEKKQIKLHGHCHQKAIASLTPTRKILEWPDNYEVELIPSGCCGMAGSFGYEKEHYDVSMKIGELVLLPAVRNAPKETLIAASGTSCRHQIWDGTKRKALHPVEILYQALE